MKKLLMLLSLMLFSWSSLAMTSVSAPHPNNQGDYIITEALQFFPHAGLPAMCNRGDLVVSGGCRAGANVLVTLSEKFEGSANGWLCKFMFLDKKTVNGTDSVAFHFAFDDSKKDISSSSYALCKKR